MDAQGRAKEIEIYLLGPFEARQGGRAVREFESDKARLLLAYLALERHAAHPREKLAELFWPDFSPASARHNLSQVIFSLKQAFGEAGAGSRLLLADRSSVALDPQAGVWVDAREFEDLLEAVSRHRHRQPAECESCRELRRRAVELYRDDFMRGLTVDASAAFDDWVILRRERLHRLALEALYELARYHEWRGEFEAGQAYARRQIALEPWREEAHRQLMRLLSHSGQRSAALAQFELLRKTLEQELGVSPSMETRALYERIRFADQVYNLPPQLTPFVGRQEEVARLLLMLANPGCRVLEILGLGGCGKTRLALRAAEKAQPRFLNGVCFLSLVGLASSDLLLPALAQALDFHFTEQAGLKAKLLDYLSSKEMLLVLDNFEHLPHGASLVAEMASSAPGVKILITSRVRLNLAQAWVVNLDGFELPSGEGEQGFWSNGAVQLFLYNARRARSDFVLADAEKEALRGIVAAVEGLPLAIEVAAAWTRLLTCTEILREIEKGLVFLSSQSVDLPPRHRSMQAVIDHTWRLLSEEEQSVLRGLGVLRGSFSRAAAEKIVAADLPAAARLPVLAALVDKSVLKKTASGRYELHELLRQSALEALESSGESYPQALRNHARFFAGLIRAREALLREGRAPGEIQEVEREMENLQAAWTWAVEDGERNLLEQMSNGLFWFCEWGNHYIEGLDLFRQAVRRLRPGARGEQVFDAVLRVFCGRFHAHLAEYTAARLLFQESHALLEGKESTLELALLLDFWGDLERETGDYQSARTRLEESVRLLRLQSRPTELALALNHLGAAVHRLGNYEQARRTFEESLDLFRNAGNPSGVSIAVYNLGHVSYDLGDYPAALALYEESRSLRRSLGDRWGLAAAYNNLGNVYYAMGDYERAGEYYLESRRLRGELGDRRGMAVTLNNLGLIAAARGETRQAEDLYRESLQICQEIGNQQGVSIALNNLGEASASQGAYLQAYEYHRQSLDIAREIGYSRGIMYTLEFLGAASLKLSRPDEAARWYREGLQRAWQARAMPRVMQSLFGLAQVAGQTGAAERAAVLLRVVIDHPATEQATRVEASALLQQEAGDAAGAGTAGRTLEAMVRDLLEE